MRIVVFSDSHNEFFAIKRIMDLNQSRGDLFLHLGDGNREFEDIRTLYPQCAFLGVAGNCDLLCTETGERVLEEGGIRILMTHGHAYGVKSGLASLIREAKKQQVQLVLYGHTHRPEVTEEDGILLFNPGTLRPSYGQKATYGIVEIRGGAVTCQIVEA